MYRWPHFLHYSSLLPGLLLYVIRQGSILGGYTPVFFLVIISLLIGMIAPFMSLAQSTKLLRFFRSFVILQETHLITGVTLLTLIHRSRFSSIRQSHKLRRCVMFSFCGSVICVQLYSKIENKNWWRWMIMMLLLLYLFCVFQLSMESIADVYCR